MARLRDTPSLHLRVKRRCCQAPVEKAKGEEKDRRHFGSPRVVLTAQLAARLLKDLLEAFKASSSVEEARALVGASWGFSSSAEMTQCIEAQANASMKSARASIRACGEASRWQQAVQLLGALIAEDLADDFSFTFAIGACEKASQWRQALDLLTAVFVHKTEPSVFPFNSALSACACGLQWQISLGLLEDLEARHLRADVVTYNCLIRSADWALALFFLRSLPSQAVRPTVISFNAALDACGKAGQWTQVLALLEELDADRGLQVSEVTLSTVMSACGQVARWQEAAASWPALAISVVNVVAFNALISAYDQGARWQEAIQARHGQLLSRLAQGCQPDIVSYNAVISACEKGGKWQQALGELSAAARRGLAFSAVTWIAAVAACGVARWPQALALLAEATRRSQGEGIIGNAAIGGEWLVALNLLQALEGLGAGSVVATNSAITACERGTFWRPALDLLCHLRASRRAPDVISYNAAISACEKAQGGHRHAAAFRAHGSAWDPRPRPQLCAGAAQAAWSVQKRLSRLTASVSEQAQAAIGACGKARRWQQAVHLLGALIAEDLADVFSFTSAISACEKASQWRQALDLLTAVFAHKTEPSVFTYNSALSACARGSQWQISLGLLQDFEARHLRADVVTYNCLIRSADWALALFFLRSLPSQTVRPTVISFNAALDACGKAGQWTQVLALLAELLARSGSGEVTLSEVTLSTVVSACGRAARWQEAAAAWRRLSISVVPNVVAFNALISAYDQGGQWQKAIQALCLMQEPDIVSYNAVISACEKGAEWRQALAALGAAARRRLAPGAVSFTAAVAACGAARRWPEAVALLEAATKRSQATGVTWNAAIAAVGEQWLVALALLEALEGGLGGDLVATNSAITACERGMQWQPALALLCQLQASRRSPDVISCNAAISACEKGNSAMDPTPDEAAQLQTIGDVFTWAGLVSSEMEAGTTLSGSLAAVLGVKPGTKPRVLGVSSCSDFENVLQSWRIRVGDHDRAPTIAEWGMARLVGRACRTVAGATELEALKAQLAQAQAAAPQTLPPAVAGSLSSTATRRIKMSAIISQVDESEVFMMEEKKVIKCYARYEAVSRPGFVKRGEGKGKNKGDFITRSVAAYPGLLNKALAEALVSATQVLKPVQLVRHVTVNDKEATIRYKLPMRGTQDQTAPQDDRNSLRNVYRWVTDRHRYIGVQCRNIIEELLDSNPNIQEQVLESFGRKSAPSIENEQWVDDLRARIAELLVRNRRDDQPKHCDTSEVDTGIYSTVIRGRFLHYWAHVVGDPAELCARWTYEGAPAGLQVPTNALDGVFPCVDADEEHTSLDNLATDYGNFQNYTGVEDSSEAFDALEGYARKGYLAKFQTLEEAVLPRLTDAVYSALELMKGCVDSEQSLLVADILLALVEEASSSNVVSKKALRTLLGKSMAIASIVFTWRPFLQELYAVLHSEDGNAPQGCVWSKQMRPALTWLRTFLQGELAGVTRLFTLDAYLNRGPKVLITRDSSPFGMGATLEIEGATVEFFAIPITELDQDVLGYRSGDCTGQQAWEGLCGLIALRQWKQFWLQTRARLSLRNDNVGALTIFGAVKGRSQAQNILAREYALDLGQAQFKPDVLEHIPGKAFVLPSTLSGYLLLISKAMS
ncbi:unnamed protein product [Effrenium voratum]|nr:unnamed protein product [Effrenium voratum]